MTKEKWHEKRLKRNLAQVSLIKDISKDLPMSQCVEDADFLHLLADAITPPYSEDRSAAGLPPCLS
jgi:hypothetical protein